MCQYATIPNVWKQQCGTCAKRLCDTNEDVMYVVSDVRNRLHLSGTAGARFRQLIFSFYCTTAAV